MTDETGGVSRAAGNFLSPLEGQFSLSSPLRLPLNSTSRLVARRTICKRFQDGYGDRHDGNL